MELGAYTCPARERPHSTIYILSDPSYRIPETPDDFIQFVTHLKMADRKGTIFVTGTNGGLGSAIVSKIISSPELSAGYHGIYTVRKVETATVLNQALASAPSTHSFDKVALDLSKLSSVREVANAINRRVAEGSLPPIRALILNAGYQEHTTHDFSPDGFDMTFQSNYLSHWLLTLMLLQSMDKEHGRVVVLGSWLHE